MSQHKNLLLTQITNIKLEDQEHKLLGKNNNNWISSIRRGGGFKGEA